MESTANDRIALIIGRLFIQTEAQTDQISALRQQVEDAEIRKSQEKPAPVDAA